jgi:DNA-binding winged helix-turn-helix (wHTH) protein
MYAGNLLSSAVQDLNCSEPVTDDAVRLGQFRFELRRRELFRDESSVRLGGRALDVLHALAAAKGDVVSKTELLERGKGMGVGENNL